MLVKVTNVGEPITQSGKNGKTYKVFDLEYEANGKLGKRKIFSFTDIYDTLQASMPDQQFNVKVVKNGQYFDWAEVIKAANGSSGSGENDLEETSAKPVQRAAKPAFATKPAGSWETAEERANRQELIVRQSSLSAAVSFHELIKDHETNLNDVIDTAKTFRDWVFGVEPAVTPRAE